MAENPQKIIVQLMQRGATLLSESCPKCGGLQVRYKGRVVCPKDDDINSIEQLEVAVNMVQEMSDIHQLVISRIQGLLKGAAKKGTSELELSQTVLNYMRVLAYVKRLNNNGNEVPHK